ncbi:MAG: DUF3492 domain-containing protein [Candidatus Mcinerneyibacterium aminivorans]|uniref:DUF3492 domain-containing protein n=1 Tax=Candidatus Mcinerneyibacterium aminivorans TaxID=2703815 RepID=A0A5D0MDL4_9BACT|nr:MAG: DUF3492 domain-containing protein [Candidatus Mcinerneyibacterium aminivorans]
MKICIIAEGCFPYISGGVSSWVHKIIRNLKQHEFEILSIMPAYTDQLEYKYDIPSNVNSIKTIYLKDYKKKFDPRPRNFDPSLNKDEKESIEKFLKIDDEINWQLFSNTISDPKKTGNPIQFIHSELFWNMMKNYYYQEFEDEGFTEFFWTFRAMFLFFMTLMQQEVQEADIYHSVSTGYSGFLGLIQKFKRNKPFLVTEHGIYAREREEEIIQSSWVRGIYKKIWIKFFYFIARGAYQNAEKVISLYERNKQFQIQHGADSKKTFVIPNGVDISKYKIKRKEHESFNIGAVLRIVPIKDVKTLLRAYKMVRDEIDNTRLYLIGPYDENTEYYNECLSLISKLELANNIIITGKVKVIDYLDRLDTMVLTSISEGQPLVILEAMAAKIPFVATDVGSCRELLYGDGRDNFGRAGIVVEPVSPIQTAKAIIDIYKDEKRRIKMGENGRKRIEKYYRIEFLINEYDNIYKKIGS